MSTGNTIAVAVSIIGLTANVSAQDITLAEIFEKVTAIPEITDQQLDEAIKGMGQTVTEENRKRMREMMDKSKDLLKTRKMTGSHTETYLKISSPELNKGDFQFVPPKTAVLKDSLFGSVLNGGK